MGLGLGWKLKDNIPGGDEDEKRVYLKAMKYDGGDERNSYTLENLCGM